MIFRAPVTAAAASLALAACGDGESQTGVCGQLQAGELILNAQCGPTLDFTPINRYEGELTIVQDREDAVVLINGDCTGTLIAAQAGPVVLTAGHCVSLGSSVLAAFNVEAEPDGDRLATNGVVIEWSDAPDYALIRIDQLPAVTPTPLTTRPSDLLAIIQHPRGGPKVIAEGRYAAECEAVNAAGVVSYADLDTLVGSSGAGVLNRQGYVFAVHTDGDCAQDGGGSNMGWSAASIVEASSYLQGADIADR
ncbi:MAG TPA: serine protease [Kofleriaceae bacterium]|jgi:hypothetical protein|nr:serine protease [Kofleriaceae bacterium]